MFFLCFCFTAKRVETWYKSQRSLFGRIKLLMGKSGSAPPDLKYKPKWVWTNLAFLKPHIKNKSKGVLMTKVSICKDEYEKGGCIIK